MMKRTNKTRLFFNRTSGRTFAAGFFALLVLISTPQTSSAGQRPVKASHINLSPESIPGDSMLRAEYSLTVDNSTIELNSPTSKTERAELVGTLISWVKDGGVSIHF
jgi:hypothetical protein